MRIEVKLPDSKTLSLCVDPGEPVAAIKESISFQLHVPVAQMTLVDLKGKVLQSRRLICDSSVFEGMCLSLRLKSKNPTRRWTKYHKEPLHGKMMRSIWMVRFGNASFLEAEATHGIPARTLRRYVQISQTRPDSAFYMAEPAPPQAGFPTSLAETLPLALSAGGGSFDQGVPPSVLVQPGEPGQASLPQQQQQQPSEQGYARDRSAEMFSLSAVPMPEESQEFHSHDSVQLPVCARVSLASRKRPRPEDPALAKHAHFETQAFPKMPRPIHKEPTPVGCGDHIGSIEPLLVPEEIFGTPSVFPLTDDCFGDLDLSDLWSHSHPSSDNFDDSREDDACFEWFN